MDRALAVPSSGKFRVIRMPACSSKRFDTTILASKCHHADDSPAMKSNSSKTGSAWGRPCRHLARKSRTPVPNIAGLPRKSNKAEITGPTFRSCHRNLPPSLTPVGPATLSTATFSPIATRKD